MKTATRWFLILLLFVFVVSWNYAVAAVELDQMGCMTYAGWSRDVIWAREVGADKDKVRVSLIEMANTDESGAMRLVVRDFERLWATRADRNMVGMLILRECYSNQGQYDEST